MGAVRIREKVCLKELCFYYFLIAQIIVVIISIPIIQIHRKTSAKKIYDLTNKDIIITSNNTPIKI